MKLSVIIVNYNVRFFLEQCLHSVFGALRDIDAEVFVVDNNSVDGSVAMVRETFPRVLLIENGQNLGFSIANNIAIRKASGEYVLLLNPDTLIEEDTFGKSLTYMEANPDCGGLGVKMIDGKGNFLPESKRGLPTPWVAFYKMFGLSRLFPKSKVFGRYNLSYLDENSIHDIDVLCGAFMLLRKKALDSAGVFDEAFFMYGEDIDLSYRIQQSGYRIVYFPQSTIIHYKGESTKKGSLNYVYLFYKAMQTFARKHFTGSAAWWLHMAINAAIYFRASLSAIKRIVLRLLLPVLDIILILVGVVLISRLWGSFWFDNPNYYALQFFASVVPVYAAIWFFSLLFSGAYDPPLRFKNVTSGIVVGTIIILIVYALLPAGYHYSRVVILLSSIWALLITMLVRLFLSLSGLKQYALQFRQRKKILIAGSLTECERVHTILDRLQVKYEYIGYVATENEVSPRFLGLVSQIKEVVDVHRISEIIFCSRDIGASQMINFMLSFTHNGCDFKIAPANSDSIIGSNSISNAGDLYVYNTNSIATAKNRRIKRTFDLLTAILLVPFIPVWIWHRNRGKIVRNIIPVLVGRRTWVAYTSYNLTNYSGLKKGVFTLSDAFHLDGNDRKSIEKMELAYARNYLFSNDLKIFVKAFFSKVSTIRIKHNSII